MKMAGLRTGSFECGSEIESMFPCAHTSPPQCMEEPVQALELPKVWRDLDVPVGNTVCTLRRQGPSTASFTSCCKMLEDCSCGSVMPLRKFPWCMGFIARFL